MSQSNKEKPRYVFKYDYEQERYLILDTHNVTERYTWKHGRRQPEMIPETIISFSAQILPYCCAITEVGSYNYRGIPLNEWASREGLTDWAPDPEAIDVLCTGLMKRLKREHVTVALSSFLKFNDNEEFYAHEIMECLLSKHGWTKLGDEFVNNRYTNKHTLQTIKYQFPPRRQRNVQTN